MFLKLKNDNVTIKLQGCTGGRKNRNWIQKQDTPLTTIYIEGLMMSCMIDAVEGCDVATAYIPVFSLQTDYKKEIYILKCKGKW